MSNDLISRSEVLKTLEYVFNKYNMAWDKHGGFAEEVPESIRNLPTAYDVDKVAEQLEERKNYLLKEFVLAEKAREVKEKSLARINEIDGIIENVKAGGIIDNH